MKVEGRLCLIIWKDHKILFYPDELRQMGLYERVKAIIRCFSLNTTPDPYIIFFLDIVLEFTRQNRIPIEDFMINWREKNDKYSIVVPEGMDAVMVMTIHKAKGLEFPVVIYPFANNMVRIRNEQKWTRLDDPELPQLKTVLLPVNKQLEGTEFEDIYSHEQEMALLDLLNLLYVATTRPTQKLFIICDLPDEKENIKHIPSILRKFLESKDLWQEGVVDYSWGDAIPPEKKKKDSDAASPEMFISSDWRKNIMLSGQAANYWDLDDDARNLEWGKLVHDVPFKN